MSDQNEEPKRVRPLNWDKGISSIEEDRILGSGPGEFRTREVTGLPPSEALPNGEWGESPETDTSTEVRIMTWSAGVILSVFLGGFGWWFFNSEATQSGPSSNAIITKPGISAHEVPEITLYDIPPATVAKNFALSNSVQERLEWARNPEEIVKRLSQYPEQARDTPASKVKHLSPITIGTLSYETFLAEFADGSRRFLCVVGTPHGPRVDWDAYARYGTASWEDILAGKISQATVRIFPELSTHYLRNYEDREKWLAIALSSPDLELPLYGYVDKTSDFFDEIKEALSSSARRATLDLKITPENVPHRQVEIIGLRTLGWVVPDSSPKK